MSVTLADIAQALGLSPSTVSRALSDPDKVNPQTRERVRKAARRMGYVPSQVARSLTSGQTDVIRLIVPDIAQSVLSTNHQGGAGACKRARQDGVDRRCRRIPR